MFDNAVLLKFLQGFNDDKHKKIITVYRSSMQKHFDACQKSMENRDSVQLRNTTHDVKSTALMIGYTALGELAKQIELAAIENRNEEAFELTPALFPHFQTLLEVLDNAAQE